MNKLKISKKQIYAIMGIILLTIILTSTVDATLITKKFTITSGIYPNAVKYTIYIENNVYKIKSDNGELYTTLNLAMKLNSLITALGQWDGATFYFTNGNYYFESAWTITSKSGITIIGENMDTTYFLLANGENHPIISSDTTGSLTIKQINFYSEGTNNAIAIYTIGSRTGIFRDLYIQNFGLDGLRIDGGSSYTFLNRVDNVRIRNCTRYGIYVMGAETEIYHSSIATSGSAIYFTSSAYANVIGGSFEGNLNEDFAIISSHDISFDNTILSGTGVNYDNGFYSSGSYHININEVSSLDVDTIINLVNSHDVIISNIHSTTTTAKIILESGSSDYNIIYGVDGRDKISTTIGANTHFNLSWNATNWVG